MNHKAKVAIGALVVAIGGAGAYLAPRGGQESARIGFDLAAGEAIYAENCQSCHGAKLEGQPDWRSRQPNGRLPAPPHDASGHTWHHPDGMLHAFVKYGPAKLVGQGYESDMPGFGGVLTDEQIATVLAYIKSRWPDEIKARQAAITEQARARGG